METEAGKHLLKNAKYIIQIRISKTKPFSKVMDSILAREYGLIVEGNPYFGIAAHKKGKITFMTRNESLFSDRLGLCTLSAPIEKKEEIDRYVSEALGEYSKEHEDKPEINRRVISTAKL